MRLSRSRTSGSASSRRRCESGRPASKATVASCASMRAAVVARRVLAAARARGRPAAVCGAPRRAAVAAACTSSPLTSGIGLRAALEQVAGDEVGVRVAGHQRARGLAVHALALGPGEVLLDRGGHQAVGQALAVGTEHPGGQQRVARRGQLADRDAGDGRHDVRERAVAEDGERRGHGPVAGRQRRQPPADDVAGDRGDGRRVVAGPVDHLGAVGGDLPAQLAQQPRVAAHGAMAFAAHGRRGLGRQAADELRRAARRQPLGMQDGGRPHPAEQAQEVRRSARVVDARADGDQQRQVVDPTRQVAQHLQRGAVGPLRVVDHERERALLGERRAQPQHPVGHEHRRVAAGDGPLEQQRCRPTPRPRRAAARARRRRPRAAGPRAARARPRRGSGARAGPAPRGARGSRRRRRSARRARAAPSCPGPRARRARRPRRRPRSGSEPLRRAPRSRPRARSAARGRDSSRAAVRRHGDGTPRCDSRHGPCSVRRTKRRNLPSAAQRPSEGER